MADNVAYTPGSGATVAADEVGGVLYQRVKPVWGVDGSVVDASATNPLPVVQTGAVPAGTNNIGDVDVLTLPGVTGNVAHDAVDSGNPVKIGGKAIDWEAMPTSVAPGDRVDAAYTPKGIAAVALFDPETEQALATLPVTVSNDMTIAAGDNNIGNVDVVTVPAPLSTAGGGTEATAHRVTIANDSTGVLSVDDNGASLTVDGTVAISGTVVLGAGGSTNIGDIDVVSITPGVGTTNLGKAIDDVVDPTDVGVAALVKRVDTPATLTPANGDWAALQVNSLGALYVAPTTLPALVAGSANIGDVDVLTLPALPAGNNNIGDVDIASLPAAATGYVGDAAATATPTGIMEIGLAKAAAPTDVSADNDAVSAWRLRNGAAATVITAAGALVGGDATNGLDVDVTRLPALVAGSANIGDVDVASIAAGDNNIGNVDVVTLPALVAGSANIGDVDVLTVPADPFGATADAVVAAGATGSISAKLRRATQGLEDLKTGIILAAGSAAIGKLAANSGVDIGDVDVTSSATLANGQVNISSTAATLVAARTGRKRLTLVNRQVAPVFVGIATVTTANGFQIDAGASLTLETSALIQGITAAASGATEKVHYIEEYT